jgi:GTP-binding protein
LRRVCLLIDARHGIKEVDRPLLDMLDHAGISYQVVLTKTDKLSPTALAGTAERVAAELASHTAAHPEIQLTSAEEHRGIAALRATLASLAIAPSDAPAVAAPE